MKTLYTTINPIPSHIPRLLAIDILQSHSEIITLNPLVLEHHPIKAPRDAPNDEFYSSWYEITERIQFMPGVGKIGSGKLTFRGCFHDQPYGVQTHIYVPMGVDLRHKYQIKGNQPGEPPEPRELGSEAPAEGLYLRVDVQIKCNFTMLSFVKKELKAASATMIDRMIKKAELIDAGRLQTMFENGKLKTLNPHDRSNTIPPNSPGPYSPNAIQQGGGGDMRWRPGSQSQNSSNYMRPPSFGMQANNSGPVIMEMPGDYPPSHQDSHLSPPNSNRYSTVSDPQYSPQARGHWSSVNSDNQSSAASVTSRPTSYVPTEGLRSPEPHKSFAAELPNNEAIPQAHNSPIPQPLGSPRLNQQQQYYYNPQDYAGVKQSG